MTEVLINMITSKGKGFLSVMSCISPDGLGTGGKSDITHIHMCLTLSAQVLINIIGKTQSSHLDVLKGNSLFLIWKILHL